ncbi:MAG: polyphosphate polymerase domain-containing protein [Bacteroidia bacterium]
MENTEQQLHKYQSISLEEMDRVRLLNRIDRKYVLDTGELKNFLELMYDDYMVLEVNSKRQLRYETRYYDTPDYKLYFMHLHGFGRRFKVRKRFYKDSSVRFFELKTKTNQGKTEKQRLFMENDQDSLSSEVRTLLQADLPFSPDQLEPGLFTGYDRITLVNKHINERVTIDLNLFFVFRGIKKSMDDLVIIEVKQGAKQLTPAVKALRELRRKPGGLSKYCLGMIMTNPDLRHNRFKPLTLQISKLTRVTTA